MYIFLTRQLACLPRRILSGPRCPLAGATGYGAHFSKLKSSCYQEPKAAPYVIALGCYEGKSFRRSAKHPIVVPLTLESCFFFSDHSLEPYA
jgi:hypothetical protein